MMKADEKESLLNMEGGSSSNNMRSDKAAQAVKIGSSTNDEEMDGGQSSSLSHNRQKIQNNKSDDDDHDGGGGDKDSAKAKAAAAAASEAVVAAEKAEAEKEKEKKKNDDDDVALLKQILMTWGSVLALLGLVTILLVVIFEAFIMAFIPLGCIHWLILQPQLDKILVGGWMNMTTTTTITILQHRHGGYYQKNIIQGICNAVLRLDKDIYATSTTIAIGFINCLPLGPKDDTQHYFIINLFFFILMIIWGVITGAILIHIPLRKLHRTVHKDWPNTQQSLRAREFLVLQCFAVVGCSMIGIILSLSFDDEYPAPGGTVVAMIVYLGLLCLTAIIRLGRYMHKQDWYRKAMMWDVTTTTTTTTTKTTSADASNSHTVV